MWSKTKMGLKADTVYHLWAILLDYFLGCVSCYPGTRFRENRAPPDITTHRWVGCLWYSSQTTSVWCDKWSCFGTSSRMWGSYRIFEVIAFSDKKIIHTFVGHGLGRLWANIKENKIIGCHPLLVQRIWVLSLLREETTECSLVNCS